MSITILRPWGALAQEQPLTLVCTTTGANETATLNRMTVSQPTLIHWGDGAVEMLPANSTAAATHTYAVAGAYSVVVERARYITQVDMREARWGGLNTAQLRRSAITYFWVTGVTGASIDSAHMVDWRPNAWGLYNMPSGTYSIDSAHMVGWRPSSWRLYNMPSGTYTIDSAHMVDWRPNEWGLYNMPSGTYTIDSAHMVDWRPNEWGLYNMPSGTYTIDTAHMVEWRPADWALFAMPPGTYQFAAECMRHWAGLTLLRVSNLDLPEATVDAILADIYAGKAGYTAATPSLNISGSNAPPSGVYQDVCPPTSGLETIYALSHENCIAAGPEWTITYNGGSAP